MDNKTQLFLGNNIELLRQLPDNSVDAIVTDPPYGLGEEPNPTEVLQSWITTGYHEIEGKGFMGKEWDAFVPQPIFWKEAYRVLKHGGHVLSFFGTRTYDWGVMAMRFAGFEVRDCIQWLYGSGFPKSHNISKAIDKMAGAEREVIGEKIRGDIQKAKQNGSGYLSDPANRNNEKQFGYGIEQITKPSTEEAKQWDGWGSALKPAHEDLVLARKPFQFSSNFVYLYENVIYNLKLQICQSKLFARDAKEIFMLSQKESKTAGLDFVQWSVGKPFNTKEDLLVLMDMLQLELKAGNTTLNIVLLWLNTLVEFWNIANIYTTETESSTITELRILNSLEWESIFQNITHLKDNKTDGFIANVLTAESLFSVLNLKLKDILTHSAKENVILKESAKNFVPNSEPIVLARKPLEKGLSIAENILKHSTGGLNIDGCRVNFKNEADYEESTTKNQHEDFGSKPVIDNVVYGDYSMVKPKNYQPTGRFPANLILTHHPDCECVGTKKVKAGKNIEEKGSGGIWQKSSGLPCGNQYGDENGEETVENWNCHPDCPVKLLDEQSGDRSSTRIGNENMGKKNSLMFGGTENKINERTSEYRDFGGASRFFYTAKASKEDRNEGLKGFEETFYAAGNQAKAELKRGNTDFNANEGKGREERNNYNQVGANKNFHPTVKPTELMRYLCRLITPPNGVVLDPFMGSGSTGKAAILEGFKFIGMELEEEYYKIAEARIAKAERDYLDSIAQLKLF